MAAGISFEEYLKQQTYFYNTHLNEHSGNAFCGNAGPEEMKHLGCLLDTLPYTELKQLVAHGGIKFEDHSNFDRNMYVSLVQEIDREDFYRVYSRLFAIRTKPA